MNQEKPPIRHTGNITQGLRLLEQREIEYRSYQEDESKLQEIRMFFYGPMYGVRTIINNKSVM